MPPSEDKASLDDDEFVVPEDPVEQERFKRRLIATASSLKKKQQQLRADQDLLADRWTEVLAAEEYKLDAHPRATQSAGCYPNLRRKQLNLHHQRTMRPIGHPVAATERPSGP